VAFAANFTEAYSRNMDQLYPQGGREIMLFSRVARLSYYRDANVFFDVTPAVRWVGSRENPRAMGRYGEPPELKRANTDIGKAT
jgi:hypothetical protein